MNRIENPQPVHASHRVRPRVLGRDRTPARQQAAIQPNTGTAGTRVDRPQASATPIENAVRLMSETAHDLRSPLTTVREAIRLVREGDAGDLSTDQAELLGVAMDQCDCIDQMVSEMVQLERLRTGAPRANRRWIELEEIRNSVDETLRPWALPKKIDLLWDLVPHQAVFADASMIRRLVVNLAVNAIRASDENQFVLIRFSVKRDGETVGCDVIDQGSGMDERTLRRIARHQVSFSGGEGLGLTICRQLAAVHFSSLQIRSQVDEGTQVSFELPASGPHSVATAWIRWRQSILAPRHRPERRSEPLAQHHSRAMATRSRPVTVQLHQSDAGPRFKDTFAAGIVTLGATVSREAADQFCGVMARELRKFDLAYRIDTRRWVWALDADANSVVDRMDTINAAAASCMEGVRSTWGQPQFIPIAGRGAAARLSDLMVRESLSAASCVHGLAQDEVRLGTAPIGPSVTASERLDEELRRLSRQMRSQSRHLQQQSQGLRPRV